MLYTRKMNPIFSDIQNVIFDFEVAEVGETNLIREATLKSHIPGSLRGVTILRYGLELPRSQLNLGSVKRPWYAHLPVVLKDHG